MSFAPVSPVGTIRVNRVLFWFLAVVILIWAFAVPKTVYADDESPDPNAPQVTQLDDDPSDSSSQEDTPSDTQALDATLLGNAESGTISQDPEETDCVPSQDPMVEVIDCIAATEESTTDTPTADNESTDAPDNSETIDTDPTADQGTEEEAASTTEENNSDQGTITEENSSDGIQADEDESADTSDPLPAEASDNSLITPELDTDQSQALPDPQFCPTGTVPGDPGCTTSQHTGPTAIADALADASSDGVIYMEDGAIFNEEVYIHDHAYDLTISGGWDFATNSQRTTSTLNAPIYVTNTTAVIRFFNIIFGINAPITLDNVSNITIDLGAGDETITLPEVTAISASNLTVDGGDGDDDVTLAKDIVLAGGDLNITAERITVNPGVMISTREISGTNHDTSNSSGDSGDIEFTAQTITVGNNAKLYAHVQSGSAYNPGDITLLAENIVDSPVVVFSAVEAEITLGSGVVIKGGDIELKSEAGDEGEDQNPAVLDQFISALENWGTDIASLPVSVLYKSADALVEVGSNAQIIASGSVNIEAIANASAEAKAIFQNFSLGFAYAGTSAEVRINNGAQITAQGDVTVHTNATSTAKMTTRTQMNLGVFPSNAESVAFSLAIVWSKVLSHATVSPGAVIISSAGNINILSEGKSEAEASAETGNYDDGRAGISISIQLAQGDVQAIIGGSLTAAGAEITDPNSDLTEGIGVKATYISSDKSTAEGGTGGDPDWGDVLSKGEVSATKIISSLSKAFSNNSDKDKTQSNTKTDLSIAGALAFSWVDNYVKAQIQGTAVLKSGMDLDISAEIVEAAQVASQASVEKPDNSVKDVAVSAAIAIGLLTNKAETIVESGAALDAKRGMTISATVKFPYLTDWDEYLSSLNPLATFQEGAAGIGDQDAIGSVIRYFDFSLGIQEAFFNSWVRSTAQADELGIAGSVNFMSFTNIAETTVGENVNINQDAACQTDDHTVTVEANILVRLINMAGVFDFDISPDNAATVAWWNYLKNKKDPLVNLSPVGSESEKGGVGGSIFILLLNNTARAQVGTGTKIHTGTGQDGFTLKAVSSVFNFSFVQSGGKAGQFGVSGMFSLNLITDVTEALLASGVAITGGPVSVIANDSIININIAGAVVKGSGVGVGAAIAINVFDRAVRAIVGSTDINTIGGSSTIDVDGDMIVSATADGAVWSFTAAAALVKEEGKQEEKGTEPSSPTTPELSDTDDPLDGISLPTLFGDMTPEEKEEQKKEQQTGVAIAGSVSFNFSRDNVIAAINQGGTITPTGALEVTADNETWMISASGSAAISSTGTTTSAGLSGAFSVVMLVSDTRAFIAGPNVIADHLNVRALHGGRIISVTGGGSGATKENGKAVAGSISVNIILSDTQAYLKNLTATLSNDSSVTAKDETMIISVAGAAAYGGKSGVGLSLAVNLIGFSNKPGIVVNFPAVTKAYIEDSIVTLSGDRLDVFATTTLNDTTLPRIVAVTGSGGISTGTTGTAGAGMISINIVKNLIEAYIRNSTIADASDVSVKASDDSWIISVGGAVAVSGGTGLGSAIGYNEIASTVQAFLDTVDLTSSGALSLIAESRAIIASATVGVAASTSSGIAGASSIAINILHNVTRAFITNNSQVDAGGAIEVLAKDISLLISIAGSVGASAGSAGVGAALSYNLITNTIAAFIMSSKVSTASTLTISSVSAPMLIAIALGGGGGTSFGFGGSVTVNSIANTVDAHISGTIAEPSDIDAIGNITLSAHESATMYVLAGAGAGSGSAAVGASVAYNYVGGSFDPANPSVITYVAGEPDTGTQVPVVDGGDSTTTSGISAYISYTDLHTDGDLYVTAGFDALPTLPSLSDLDSMTTLTTTDVAVSPVAQITNLTFAGSGAGTFAAGGAVSLNFIHSSVSAYIANTPAGGIVQANGRIDLNAVDQSSIYAIAGSGAGAGVAAVGASVAVNEIRNSVSAYIDNAQVASLTSAVALIASEKATLVSLALGGAGAGTVAVSGSVSVNFIQNTISAYISNLANVIAAGDINLSAQDTSLMLVGAGNGAGSGTVAGAVAFAYNSIANMVTAYIDSSIAQSSNGDITLSTATAPPVSFPILNTTNAPVPDAQIYAFVVSGSGSGVVSGAISFAFNSISNTVKAEITGSTRRSVVTASNGDIGLTASDGSSIKSLAGSVSGAGAGAVGVSWAKNEIANTVKADISNAVITGSAIDLGADSTSTISTLAAGGSGAGGVSIAGSIAKNVTRNIVTTYVNGNALLIASTDINLTSTDTSTINALAGGAAGAGGVSIGAALATNTLNNQVASHIDSSVAQANNFDLDANSSATSTARAYGGTGAILYTYGGSIAKSITGNTTEAYVANGANIQADKDITISATSIVNAASYAGTGTGSAVAQGSSDAYVDLRANSTSARVGGLGTRIIAGGDFTLSASASDTAYSDAYSGAGGVSGTAWAKSTVDVDDKTDVTVGDGVHITAANQLSITTKKSTTVTSKARVDTGGVSAGADAQAYINMPASEINSSHNTNTVTIGANAQLQARDILLLTTVTNLNTNADASSVSNGGFAGSNAYAENKTASDAVVNINSSASLAGANSLRIRAVQNPVSANDKIWAYSSAHANNINAAGGVSANARTNLVSNTLVTAALNSSISTHQLMVMVFIPSGTLFNSFATRQGSWGINGGGCNRYGDLTLNRAIDFQPIVTLLGGNPILVIGADDTVEEQDGITFTETSDNIIVDDINNTSSAATANFAISASIYDPVNSGPYNPISQGVFDAYKTDLTSDGYNAWYGTFDFSVTNTLAISPVFNGITTLNSVTVINKSNKDLVVNNIQIGDGTANWSPIISGQGFDFDYTIINTLYVWPWPGLPSGCTETYGGIFLFRPSLCTCRTNISRTTNQKPAVSVITATGPTHILIQNTDDVLYSQDPTDIILQGQIDNPLGITQISTDAGSVILQAAAQITSNQVNIAVLDDNDAAPGGVVELLGKIISPNASVSGGAGKNVIIIAQTPVGTNIHVDAGPGNDVIRLGGGSEAAIWSGTIALYGGDGDDQFVYYPNVLSNVTIDGGRGFDELIFHLNRPKVGLVVQGPGSVDGIQGYASSIPLDKFDNINSIVYSPGKKPKEKRTGIPVILVESDEIVRIHGYKLGVILRLPNGDQVYFAPGVGNKASLAQVLEFDLPKVPDGLRAASTMLIKVWHGSRNLQPSRASMIVSFVIPAELKDFEFAILFWDITADGGAGGWIEVPSFRIQDSLNGMRIERQVARVNQTGIYILVIRSPKK